MSEPLSAQYLAAFRSDIESRVLECPVCGGPLDGTRTFVPDTHFTTEHWDVDLSGVCLVDCDTEHAERWDDIYASAESQIIEREYRRSEISPLLDEIDRLRRQRSTDKLVAMNANQRIEIDQLRAALRAIRALDLSPNQPGKLAAARREIERLTRDALEGE